MQLFRVRQIHNATYVRLKRPTMKRRMIDPYVTFGEPTRKTVSDLTIPVDMPKSKSKEAHSTQMKLLNVLWEKYSTLLIWFMELNMER